MIKITLELRLYLLLDYKKVELTLAWVNPDLKADLLLLYNTEKIENKHILAPATKNEADGGLISFYYHRV